MKIHIKINWKYQFNMVIVFHKVYILMEYYQSKMEKQVLSVCTKNSLRHNSVMQQDMAESSILE